jgi:nucleoside-diphosphate-sugar epimerase
MNYIRMFLLGYMPAYPNVRTPLVDVRDLANAHLQAAKVPEAKNKRIILSNEAFHFREVCETLSGHYGELFPKIPKVVMPECPPAFPRFALIWGKDFNLDRS